MSGHSKRKHSDFSPSAAKRWMNCPGSVRLSRLAPPQGESIYAREGTDAHECLEFIVKRFKDRVGASREAATKWPVEMIEHALTSADRIFSTDLRPSRDAKLLVETRVVIRSVSHKLFGTLDYAWVDEWGTLSVIDYKYGAGVPVLPIGDDGKPNEQLMLYALGIAEKYNFDFDSVKLAIIQPRVWRDGEDPLSTGDVSIKTLKEFRLEVKEAVKEAQTPNARLSAGDHCRWCPAAATCPENSKTALEAANIAFDIESGDLQAAPNPLTLDTKTLPKILDAIPRLEQWIKAVREHAYRMAEDGEKIPGYKLVAKRAQRVWLPEAKTEAEKRFGDDAFETERRFLSPAQLEKKHGVAAKAFTQKFTSSVSSGFNLVPDSDKRSEVLSTAVWDHE